MKRTLLLALPFLCVQLSSAQSNIPDSISYQGRVADAAGVLIGDGTPVNRTITLRIYGSPTGTDLIYAEQQVVTISKGQFSVLLGTGLQVGGEPRPPVADVLNGRDRFLGVTVDDGTPTADPEISPRQQITSSAFALRSKRAESSADADFAGTSSVALSVNQAFGTSNFDWIVGRNLTIDGHSKVTNQNVLEFGVGFNKNTTAGTIGYRSYSDGLDIVGAVPNGGVSADRRITMWAEGGTEFKGPVSFGNREGQHINLYGSVYGLGISPSTLFTRSADRFSFIRGGDAGGGGTEWARMDGAGFNLLGGTFNGTLDRGGHGNFAQAWGGGHAFGSQDWTTFSRSAKNFAWYLGGNFAGGERDPGGGTEAAFLNSDGLYIGGNTLRVGNGTPGQEGSAGIIGYKKFSDALDIVGAGTDGGNRKVKLWAEGGTEATGNLSVSGNVFVWSENSNFANNIRLMSVNGNANYEVRYGESGWTTHAHNGSGFEFQLWGGLKSWISGIGEYVRVSDQRMKKDITKVEAVLTKVMQLKPSRYRYKTEAKDSPMSYGLIAQEAQEVFPEMVVKHDSGMLAISYEGFIPVAIAAIQEQQKLIVAKDAEISGLKKELAAAEASNKLQDTRLAAIEKTLKLEAPAASTAKSGTKVASARR